MQNSHKQNKSAQMSNYMEELAESMLAELLLDYKGRDFSGTAKRDIKALALNRLWPMYTTSSAGKDFLRKVVQEDRIEKDIVRELRAAISIVRSNPRK